MAEGKLTKEELEKALFLAALEQIRLFRYLNIKDQIEKIGGNNTSSQILQFDEFDEDYNYVITGITAYCTTTSTPQIKIGYVSGAKFWVLECATVANAEDSVSWSGEVILRQGERVRAVFENVSTAADTIQLVMTGYKVQTGI